MQAFTQTTSTPVVDSPRNLESSSRGAKPDGDAKTAEVESKPPLLARRLTTGWREKCPSDRRLTTGWMNFFFFCARYVPWFVRNTEWFWIAMSRVCFRRGLRPGPIANARWLLGEQSTARQREQFATRVLRSFYRFIYDTGRAGVRSPSQIIERIEEVEGEHHYDQARALGRGAILATAHLGSYEAGVAAVAQRERQVHVVFAQDEFPAFEQLRGRLHERIGVREARVDQGAPAWLELREALGRDEVVLMQADRVMPGQRGLAVPFMGGHIELPVGPVKLAAASGAPIIPVFAVRLPSGKMKVILEPPIHVNPDEIAPNARQATPAIHAIGRVLEKHVHAYPDQWLALHPAWIEDRDEATGL